MSDRVRAFIALTGGGTGSLDAKPVAGISDGDIAFGIVNGLYHPYTYDAASTESEASPYFIIPNDNVSGTGAWILGGFQGAMSRVRATTDAGASMATGDTFIYEDEETDLLAEYVHTTGIFTPSKSANYSINAAGLFTATWSSGIHLELEIDINSGANLIAGPRKVIGVAGAINYGAQVITDIDLIVSQPVKILISHGNGGNITSIGGSQFNYMSIKENV